MIESLYDMMEDVNSQVKFYIDHNMKRCTPEELGLDIRSGRELFVSEDGIAVHNGNRSTLDYYGGFEYVNKGCVQSLGNYTFYLVDNDRILGCVEEYFEDNYNDDYCST